MILRGLKDEWGRVITKIQGKWVHLVLFLKLVRRMFTKGRSSIYCIRLSTRWHEHQIYLVRKERRRLVIETGQRVAAISQKTGIPQWEVRSRLGID